jgi:hypothetical protein
MLFMGKAWQGCPDFMGLGGLWLALRELGRRDASGFIDW